MLESRRSYGWGGTGALSPENCAKWIVGYRSEYGGYGEVGELFATKEEAIAFGEQYKAQHSWVTEIIVKHPSKIYSTY